MREKIELIYIEGQWYPTRDRLPSHQGCAMPCVQIQTYKVEIAPHQIIRYLLGFFSQIGTADNFGDFNKFCWYTCNLQNCPARIKINKAIENIL